MPKILTTQEIIAREMREAELLDNIVQWARLWGFLVAHMRDSRRQMAEGLPDLIIVGHQRCIFIECKRELEKAQHATLNLDQQRWAAELGRGPAEYYLFRPSDWLSGKVETLLRV